MSLFDDVVQRAVSKAAGSLSYRAGEGPESQLVAAVRAGLRDDHRVRPVDGTPVYKLPGWTRPPGGVDLVADLVGPGHGRVGMEVKVAKPDESIWDAIKLADVQIFDPEVRCGYLISDAGWSPGAEGSELFARTPTRVRSCRELIARSPKAWTGTMIGGRGIRPRTSVGALKLTWVTAAPLVHHPGRRLVAVRVEPDHDADHEHYDPDGFPVGYEPPGDLRARVQRADAARRAGADRPRDAAAADTDPCHGYPWYPRWSQERLVAVIRSLSDDAAARACLRRRLMRERNWTEPDLRSRFDPYAHDA